MNNSRDGGSLECFEGRFWHIHIFWFDNKMFIFLTELIFGGEIQKTLLFFLLAVS